MKKVIAIVLLIVSVCLLCGCNEKAKAEKLSAFAKEQFMQNDYNSYITRLRKSTGLEDLEATPIVDFYDTDYKKDTKTLNARCRLKFYSDEIDKYFTTEYNTASSKKLFTVLMSLRKAYDDPAQYTYSSDSGTVNLKVVNSTSKVTVTTSQGREYEFSYYGSYDDVKIDSEYVYMVNREGSSSKSTGSGNSYSGSYDAKLEYGSGAVLIFASEDAMDRYMTALVKGYQGTMDEMMLNGEVASTERGTKCNIVSEKLTKAKVKLLDGSYAGNTVWVVIESLQKNK